MTIKGFDCKTFTYHHFGLISVEENTEFLEDLTLAGLLKDFSIVQSVEESLAVAVLTMVSENSSPESVLVSHMGVIDPLTLKITHRKGWYSPITPNEDIDKGLKFYLNQMYSVKKYLTPR
jgi:hypothetical protein